MSPRTPKPPAPPKPWQRTEAGRHASADGRFTLESDGGGRWFVTDAEELDELGLARTTGPHSTLDAAKAAAEAARERPAAASPLAARLAEAGAKAVSRATGATPAAPAGPRPGRAATKEPPGRLSQPEPEPEPEAESAPEPEPEPARTWLDDLADRDADGAKRARRLIAALEREGVAGSEALVRRDTLGDRPAVATRLLARDVLAAIARLREPTALAIAEAVAEVVATTSRRKDLPGWELVERAGPGDRPRPIRLTGDDLAAAAGDGDAAGR